MAAAGGTGSPPTDHASTRTCPTGVASRGRMRSRTARASRPRITSSRCMTTTLLPGGCLGPVGDQRDYARHPLDRVLDRSVPAAVRGADVVADRPAQHGRPQPAVLGRAAGLDGGADRVVGAGPAPVA